MIKSFKTYVMLLVAACSFAFVSCDKDDDELDNDGQHIVTKDVKVTVSEDGTVSGGHTFAAIDNETFYIDCVKYSVVEGHLEVTDYDKTIFSGVANIVYSLNYKGNTYQVVKIAKGAFQECEKLTSVNMPSSLVEIGNWAFQDCSALTSISIPNSVTTIGPYAFEDCTSLTAITLPNSVEIIGGGAFTEIGIKDVTMLSKNPPFTFTNNISAYGDCFDKGIAKLHVLPGCKNAYENYSITEPDYYGGEYTVHPYKEFFTDIIEDAKE